MSETLSSRMVTKEEPLRFGRHPYRIWRELHNGNRAMLAEESDPQMRIYADWLIRIVESKPTATSRLAYIGAGTCAMPRMTNLRRWGLVEIYEIDPDIIAKVKEEFPNHAKRWTMTLGDYRTTLTGEYDIIVYDLEDDPDIALLEAHLAADGLLIGNGV